MLSLYGDGYSFEHQHFQGPLQITEEFNCIRWIILWIDMFFCFFSWCFFGPLFPGPGWHLLGGSPDISPMQWPQAERHLHRAPGGFFWRKLCAFWTHKRWDHEQCYSLETKKYGEQIANSLERKISKWAARPNKWTGDNYMILVWHCWTAREYWAMPRIHWWSMVLEGKDSIVRNLLWHQECWFFWSIQEPLSTNQ